MKNRIVLISGVIAALVLILFLAYPYLKNSQSFLAVVAICVTFAVLALGKVRISRSFLPKLTR